jgi:ankyrin repeat protein/uncharacterized protein YceK
MQKTHIICILSLIITSITGQNCTSVDITTRDDADYSNKVYDYTIDSLSFIGADIVSSRHAHDYTPYGCANAIGIIMLPFAFVYDTLVLPYTVPNAMGLYAIDFRTPQERLMHAIGNSDRKAMEAAVADGADVNGSASLRASFESNDAVSMAQFLLKQGADPNFKSANDWSHLHALASGYNEYTGEFYSPPDLDTEVVQERLILISLLLEHGADKHAKDDDGRTPADVARLIGNDPRVIQLLETGR